MNNQKKHIKTEFVECPFCNKDEFTVFTKGYDYECEVSDDEFQIVKCKNCSLLRLNPRPIKDELLYIYSKKYNAYNFENKLSRFMQSIRFVYLKNRVNKLNKFLGANANILEGGCGDGEFLLLIRKYGQKDWKLFGNDIVNIAEKKFNSNDIKFIEGRFEDIIFNKGKWDTIILKDVLEHLENPDKVIKNAATLLRSEGILLIEIPNPEGWDAKLFKEKYWAGWHFPRHWTIYSPNQIKKQLNKYGFEIINIEPIMSPVSWLYSIKYKLRYSKYFYKIAFLFDEKYLFSTMVFYFVNVIQIIITRRTSNIRIFAKKTKQE